jgi:hypothetical protein
MRDDMGNHNTVFVGVTLFPSYYTGTALREVLGLSGEKPGTNRLNSGMAPLSA